MTALDGPEAAGRRRVGFKPHLRAHVLGEGEVALIGETQRFALRGGAYATLAPLLDGTKDAGQIVAGVDGKLSPEMAYFALEKLRAGGYTVEMPPDGLAPWPTWQLANSKDQTTGTAAAARVTISTLGIPDGTRAALAAHLTQSVEVVGDGAPLEVCLVDDYLRPELAALIGTARAEGRTVLPVRPQGVLVWLGPFCGLEDPPDWPALLERLRTHRRPDSIVLGTGVAFPVMPTVSTPETTALGLALAAMMVVRAANGDIPPAIDGSIWTFDTDSMETQVHSLPPSPGRANGTGGQTEPVELTPNPKRYTVDGGHRTVPPEKSLARLDRLVSPITGIIPGIEKVPAAPDVHVYITQQTWGPGGLSSAKNRLLGKANGAVGKGETDVQAKVSCLAEAVERYSAGFFDDVPRRKARLSELGADAVDPREVLLFSARQYAERKERNERNGDGFNWVPEPFDPDQAIDWTPLWSLSHSRTRWISTAQCYFGYDPAARSNVPRFALACSNGCASGNTLEEAILQGLFELIERDACALWWYNRVQRPSIDLTAFRQPFFDAMQQLYDNRDRQLHVIDLRTDLGVPVALAVSWRRRDGGGILAALGCHLEPRLAISRALSELNQIYCDGVDDPQAQLPSDREMARWLTDANIENQPYVVPLEGSEADWSSVEDRGSDDVSTDIRRCVERLRELGHETLVLDHTRSDVGFPTARVVVPGLRHFWARLAPGRLYDAPVALGWLDKANREADLNPIPFFL